jgi:hypothetical protein
MPLTVFIVIPFINDVAIKAKSYYSIIISGILIIALLAGYRRLINEGKRLNSNVSRIEILIKKADDLNGNKFLFKKTNEINNYTQIQWSFPFTTMVISSMNGPDNVKTIFLYDDLADYEIYLHDRQNIFLGADFWLEWNVSTLNPNYFKLPIDTYILLE